MSDATSRHPAVPLLKPAIASRRRRHASLIAQAGWGGIGGGQAARAAWLAVMSSLDIVGPRVRRNDDTTDASDSDDGLGNGSFDHPAHLDLGAKRGGVGDKTGCHGTCSALRKHDFGLPAD